MESTPLYVIIGSILGIVSGIVLLVLHFPQFFYTIRSFVTWLVKWMKRRPNAVKEWYWWRKYRPAWSIDNWGGVKIYQHQEKFHIEIPLYLKVRSRNDRYHTDITLRSIRLDMHHAGKGWEKRPYILYGQFINLDENRLVISPKTSVPVEYICEIKILAQPQVRDTVTCRLYNFSDASIRTDSVFLSGSMKRIGGNRFKAKVYANKQ